MSSTPNKSNDGPSRRQSASMGNFGNENVDRSEETVLTRKQKRLQRRETLRLQSEVAPFLGMDLDEEDDTKENEETKSEKKDEEEKKGEPKKDVIGSPLYTIPEVDESALDDKTVCHGLRLGNLKAPPSEESEFLGQNNTWWTRRAVGVSIRNSIRSSMASKCP